MGDVLIEKLTGIKERLSEVDNQLQKTETIKNNQLYKSLMSERSHLVPLVETLEDLKNTKELIEKTQKMLKGENDSDMIEMIKEEIKELEDSLPQKEMNAKMLLVPPDPLDGKNIIMEIRAGTGGEEAALFASDLFRMYSHYADKKKWKIEVMNISETLIGGIKEIIFSLSGKNVYASMKYESGTHRVQRIPETEAGGRIHTSAATVAVLPEAEETDIQIKQEDLIWEVMRAGGPGGQCVNTTDSAVRLTHKPSGLVVIQQDEKSQLRNKEKALRVLRARLFDMEEEKKNRERAENRKSQVGSGDRSERIRTYNFPQNRLTDHRIDLTLYHLDTIIEGDLDEVIEALKIAEGDKLIQESGK